MPKNELLQYWRERYPLTQEELAARVGADLKTEQRWEYGQNAYPYYLTKLKELLGKSPRELGFVRKNEYPPIPHLRLDYLPNEFFTGREDILQQLRYQLAQRKSRGALYFTALVGMGGVGKTHIVVEYTYRHLLEYQTVVFLDASSRKTLSNGFAELAYSLFNLVKREAQIEQGVVINAVREWLGNFSRYLLVFDNADDLSIIADFLPFEVRGDVIVTTQAQTTGTYAKPLHIEPMSEEEGILLLLRRAKGIGADIPLQEVPPAYRDQAREIVSLLDGLPLAIDQAGAYLEGKDLGTALAKYADRFRRESKTLLERRGKHSPPDHPRSVAATLSLALKRINRTNPLARELLKLFAFLDPNSIPRELILQNAEVLGPRFQPFASDQAAFEDAVEDAIDTLHHSSLIQRKVSKDAYSIHRLVQTIVQDDMSEQERRVWAERAVVAVYYASPVADIETLQEYQRYLPLALLCSEHIEQWNIVLPEASRLLKNLGDYYTYQGQYSLSETFLLQATTLFNNETIATIKSSAPWFKTLLFRIAYVCRSQGKHAEAEEWLQKLLGIFCKRDDCSPSERFAYLIEYALVLAERRKQVDEVSQYVNSALDSGVYYENDSNVYFNFTTLSDLLSYLAGLGVSIDHDSEGILQAIVEFGESSQAPKYYLARWYASLGGFYMSKQNRNLPEAEKFLLKSLEALSEVSGLDSPLEHPDTIHIYGRLGNTYELLGRYEDAIRALKESVSRAQKLYGEDHPQTFVLTQALARAYLGVGNIDEAIPLYNKVIAMAEEHEHEHSDLIDALIEKLSHYYYQLGRMYHIKGEYSKAGEVYIKGLYAAMKDPNDEYDLAKQFHLRLRELLDP